MFARSASEKDRPEDDGVGGGPSPLFPMIVIIAVTDFVTIFFFRKNVGVLFLSNVSTCIVRFVRTIRLGLGCNNRRLMIDSLNNYACYPLIDDVVSLSC